MATECTETPSKTPILFRAGRKRKAYRHRTEDAESVSPDAGPTHATSSTEAPPSRDDATNPGASQHHVAHVKVEADEDETKRPVDDDAVEDESDLSVAQVLKLRNARKSKLGGVAFRPESDRVRRPEGFGSDNNERQLVVVDRSGSHDPTKAKVETIIGGITKRFAPQTGIVGELVNKHMEEYIESELARRKRTAAEQSAQQGTPGIPAAVSSLAARPDMAPSMAVGKAGTPAPAMQGRLQEIDLGDEARARNEAITERAMRRLQGDTVVEDEDSSRPKKVRVGRDGKPWRPRNRRGSDDIKRDQLIDSFMRDNKLDVYNLQQQQAIDLEGEDYEEGAADDRLAEKFRRDFMDNLTSRRKRPKAATTTAKTAKPTEDILRGPKLGGSRNVRQQMRDILLKEQEKKR